MTLRVVYDTTVFVQWAMLPEGRQHATIQAVFDGSITLFMSQELINEIERVLNDPELQRTAPSLTPARARLVIDAILQRAEWCAGVPRLFTLPVHTKDDHVFNLAIAAKADYLVVWEKRILNLHQKHPGEEARLRRLVPDLKIVDPPTFAAELRQRREQERRSETNPGRESGPIQGA